MERIIISGVSRGIGYELFKHFSKLDIELIGLSRNLEPVREFENQDNIELFSLDLSDSSSFEKLNLYLAALPSKKTSLIHNAGKLVNKPFLEITQEDFSSVYEVNVFGVAKLNQIVIPKMSKGSHVVTISSIGGIQGSVKFPGLAAYSSAKGASITLSELLAEEFKESEIAFNTLALGAVQTEMLEEAFPGYQAQTKPNRMANYIADFACNGNEFYNGKTLEVSSSTP
jgi:short-subunit dehydrogenase